MDDDAKMNKNVDNCADKYTKNGTSKVVGKENSAKKLFGTDGIRGIANVYPMTCEMAMRVGKALSFVLLNNVADHRPKVILGRDTRISGSMIESAMVSGICSLGTDCLLAGTVTTPAVAFLTRQMNADAGVMITASHNPYEHNGIKIFSQNGFKISAGWQEEIERLCFGSDLDSGSITGSHIGMVTSIDDAKGRYCEYLLSTAKDKNKLNLKVVLDCANGAAHYLAPKVFESVGATVIIVNNEPDGRNINNGCGALHPEVMQRLVKEHNADIGIALDGDADRIIACDENSAIVDGDFMLAIFAKHFQSKGMLSKDAVVATVMSNLGLDSALKESGLGIVKTAVGDQFVLEEMIHSDYCLGGEQSGHIIFLDYATSGDGILAGLQLLKVMAERNVPLSELAGCMRKFPQVLVNVEVSEKRDFEKMPNVAAVLKDIEAKLGADGRVLLRYSGTENLARVMIEGKDIDVITGMADDIAMRIRQEVGVCRL